jgi:hypothetical protein
MFPNFLLLLALAIGNDPYSPPSPSSWLSYYSTSKSNQNLCKIAGLSTAVGEESPLGLADTRSELFGKFATALLVMLLIHEDIACYRS